MSEIKIHEWSARGISLVIDENGVYDADALQEFINRARDEFPGKPIRGFEFELRVIEYDRQNYGPYLDWRD